MIPKLELRHGQGLVMTPQLQQAIKLLQMSNFELQSFVEAEIERNPLLEREESEAGPLPAKAARQDEHAEAAAVSVRDSGWSSLTAQGRGFDPGDDYDPTGRLPREPTLHEHLTEQLHLSVHDPRDRLIGSYLIGMVDESGYVAAEVDATARSLGAAASDVERVLLLLQQFDPPGVCARNLKECLELQLKEAGRLDPAMKSFIAHLDLMAKRDYAQLQKVCGVGADDIRDMAEEIKRLNPKPGNAFGRLVVEAIVPDISVRPAPDGSWLVELNSDTLPKVLINRQYLAKVSRSGSEQDKLYLSQCLTNAQWLVKSLDQRARTILKVAREIVRQQDGFLIEGVQKLKPLTLKTVAEATGMHESTVSRVTANKYMATGRGTFELKYFFTTAIATTAEGEGQHSAEAVRHRIRELVAREVATSVLSDDLIVERLKNEGVDIARRTVAKYREAMGIPSSVQRRREKRFRG